MPYLETLLCVALLAAPLAREPHLDCDSDKSACALPEVAVTATHRREPLHAVPIAVSALNANDLDVASSHSLEGLARRVPAANFRTGTSTKNVSLFIRGVGTVTTSGGIEPSVATVVDGVVLAHPGQTSMALLDIDRVEVLRGPQGTLFGKNASGGVFNIVTRDPSQAQSRNIEEAWYQDNVRRLSAGMSTELSADAAWVSMSLLRFHDGGNVTNIGDGKRLNGSDVNAARSKLVWTPDAQLKLTLVADYSDRLQNTVPVFVTTPDADLLPIAPVVADANNRQANIDFDMFNADRNRGTVAQLDWTTDGHQITSISAWRDWENRQRQDVDLSPVRFIHDSGTVSLRQVSQEIRLTSTHSERWEYMAGVFHQQVDDRETYHRQLGLIADAYGDARFSIAHHNTAWYGESVIKIGPTSRLIAGLRQTRNRIAYRFQRATSAPLELGVLLHDAFANADRSSATGYSGRIGSQLDLATDFMTYATYSRGYKGPAYNVYANMWAADTRVVEPEISDSFEIGLKYQNHDNRVRLDLALFSATYRNYQTAVPGLQDGVTVMRLANAGKVGTSGLELDFTIRPAARWEIVGALAETHAHVLHFGCGNTPLGCIADDSVLPFAPRHRLSLGARRDHPLDDERTLSFGADFRWQSEVQFQLPNNPSTRQGAYGIVDAHITLNDVIRGWRVALVGKNLADRSHAIYALSQFDGLARFLSPDDRRHVGVEFRLDY